MESKKAYEKAMEELFSSIHGNLNRGEAYDMYSLLLVYKELLEKNDVSASSCTIQKLKSRIQSKFQDSVVFDQPHETN